MRCTRCGKAPRVAGQRWCRPCRAEDKRLRRAGNTKGNAGNDAGNGERGGEQPSLCPGCAEKDAQIAALTAEAARLSRRNDVLEADVANLKRDLAGRAPAEVPVAAIRAKRPESLCVHGSASCGKLYCRSAS
jgi:hypothetical protein